MRKIFAKLAKISAQLWLYLFIVSAIICVFSLRHNNQQMVKLRDAVYATDKNNGDVNTALYNLRKYVYGHMNTNLSSGNNNIKPPIQLKYTYQRLLDTEQSQLEAANTKIYTDAQNYCQSINQAFFGTTRVPCVQNYVSSHGVNITLAPIPVGLYEFDFINPTWSPDLAGWSFALSLLLLLMFLVKAVVPKFVLKK
jgi:hypothetical protein